MSDEIKIEPLTEEEIIAISKRLEDNKEFDTELARAIFTIFVSGYEYKVLYKNLQAYFSASSAGLYQLAGDCSKIIGLRDTKKIQKMYKQAATIAGNLPAIAQGILNEIPDEEEINEEYDVQTLSEETTSN
jgi:hypothetical protein